MSNPNRRPIMGTSSMYNISSATNSASLSPMTSSSSSTSRAGPSTEDCTVMLNHAFRPGHSSSSNQPHPAGDMSSIQSQISRPPQTPTTSASTSGLLRTPRASGMMASLGLSTPQKGIASSTAPMSPDTPMPSSQNMRNMFSFSPASPMTSGAQASPNSPFADRPTSAGGSINQPNSLLAPGHTSAPQPAGPRRLSQHSASVRDYRIGRPQTSTFPRSRKQKLQRPSVIPAYNAADNDYSWMLIGDRPGLSREDVDNMFTYPQDPIAREGIKSSARSVPSLPAEVEGDEDLSWDRRDEKVHVVPRRHQKWMNPEDGWDASEMKTQRGSRFIRQVFNPPAFDLQSTEAKAYYEREWDRLRKPADTNQEELERRLWPKPLSKLDSDLQTFEADGTMPGGYSFNCIKHDYSKYLGKCKLMTDVLPLRQFEGQTQELIKLKLFPHYMLEEYSVLVTFELLELAPGEKKQRSLRKLYCLPPGYYKPRKEPFNTDRHCRHKKNMEVAPGEKWGVFQLEEGYFWVGKYCLLLEEGVLLITSKKPRLMRMFYLFERARRHPQKTKFCSQIPGSPRRKERALCFSKVFMENHSLEERARIDMYVRPMLKNTKFMGVVKHKLEYVRRRTKTFVSPYQWVRAFFVYFGSHFISNIFSDLDAQTKKSIDMDDFIEIAEMFHYYYCIFMFQQYPGPSPPPKILKPWDFYNRDDVSKPPRSLTTQSDKQ